MYLFLFFRFSIDHYRLYPNYFFLVVLITFEFIFNLLKILYILVSYIYLQSIVKISYTIHFHILQRVKAIHFII
jgi:hypothetical protein